MANSNPTSPAPGESLLEQLTELFSLIDRLLSDEAAAPRAERYRGLGMNPHAARNMALAAQADRLSGLLAGLLSDQAGGVTEAGIDWALGWLRAELDR